MITAADFFIRKIVARPYGRRQKKVYTVPMKLRIQKYLADKGIASRRQAEALIKAGLVSLNGNVVHAMGVQIDPEKDVVAVLPAGKKQLAAKKTVALYKPRGIASSRMRSEGTTVYDLFPQFEDLDIVGRLDKASEGLLLLSDDGVLARQVTGDAHRTEKEYRVTVRETIRPRDLKSLEPGIELEDGLTLPCRAEQTGPHSFRIAIREGRKHQIRRMCEHIRLTVTELKRVRIGGLTLGTMKPGESRVLSAKERGSI